MREQWTDFLGYLLVCFMPLIRAQRGDHKLISLRTVFLIHGIIIAAIILITPTRIGHWFNNMATSLKGMGLPGMLLISACVSEY